MAARTAITVVDLKISSTIKNTLDATNGISTQATVGKSFLNGVNLATGVSKNQANRAWESRGRVIASGNTEDLDLYDLAGIDIGAGSGLDALGQAIVFEEIVAILIQQTSDDLATGTGGRLEIMPSNPSNFITWMPSMTVSNGGGFRQNALMFFYNPGTDAFDVADGSSHNIRLGANGGEVTYNIIVVTRHDDDESSSSSSSSVSTSSSSQSSSSSSQSSSSSSSSSSTSSQSSSSSSASSASTSSNSSSSSSSECSTS